MIAQFDVNTIWRRQFGEALRRRDPATLLFAPHALTSRSPATGGAIPVALPPGWAGRAAPLAMPILGHRATARARRDGDRIDTAIFTSFHYLPLARHFQRSARIVYYCSDDYRSYRGWGGPGAIAREAALCRLATLCVFVSEALRDRAVAEYGLDPSRCIVAPNASERRFASITERPPELAALAAPVFGTVGVFNDRIDYGFLARLAASPEVGSLALVGPVQASPDIGGDLARLRAMPKVHWLGARPHDEIHAWMAGIDIAVIPYAPGPLNHFCSPMRLWDHLAIGQPIIATDACDQVARRQGLFTVAAGDALDRSIGSAKGALSRGRQPHLETWDDRVALLAPWIS